MAKEIVTLLPGPGRENGYIPVIIADKGTDSEIADLAGFAVVGLLIPTLDTTDLTFKVSNLSTEDWYVVKDKAGINEFKITATIGGFAIQSKDMDELKGYRFIQIIASANQNGGARTFTWIVKG